MSGIELYINKEFYEGQDELDNNEIIKMDIKEADFNKLNRLESNELKKQKEALEKTIYESANQIIKEQNEAEKKVLSDSFQVMISIHIQKVAAINYILHARESDRSTSYDEWNMVLSILPMKKDIVHNALGDFRINKSSK